MRIWYHFRSQSDPNLHSVTDDPTGDKLPAENSPWVLLHEVSPDREWTLAENRAVVAAGIAENGFYLFDEGSREPASSKPVIESDRVEGTAVYDPEGKQIGTIDRLLIEKVSGRVLHVDVTFGGFLGIGTRHHTIPWEKLTYDTRLGGYRTDITEEQVRGAPTFYGEERSWPDRERLDSIEEYWRKYPPLFP